MTDCPKSYGSVFGGLSAAEGDLLAGLALRGGAEMLPEVASPFPRLMTGERATAKFFGGNTPYAPWTGTSQTRTVGATTYTGSGGPMGLPRGNTNGGGLTYFGETTAWSSPNLQILLRALNLVLEADVEYRVVIYPRATLVSSGSCLPPKGLGSCYVYRVTGTDVPHAEITVVGTGTGSNDIALTLVSAPTISGYAVGLAAGGGDVVAILSYSAAGGYGYLEGDATDEHELVWTASAGAAGARAIFWPYASFARQTLLSGAQNLVTNASPAASAALNTQQNWYCKPPISFDFETMYGGQEVVLEFEGTLSANGPSTRGVELLLMFGSAQRNGWDPATDTWFEPGPYQEFTGATWDHGALKLTLPGSGIGDAGAAACWVETGTSTTTGVYRITLNDGDSVTLDRSIGVSASAVGGYVGGLLTTISGARWISGKLAANGPVAALQAAAPSGSINFGITVRISNLNAGSSAQANGAPGYLVEAEFRFGGTGTGLGGVIGTDVTTVRRSCIVTVNNDHCDQLIEHLSITPLIKAGDAATGAELSIPGVHGWFAGQPYDPKTGQGWPLVFPSGSPAAPTIAPSHTQRGAGILRTANWSCSHMGSWR